jgi:hypothetical protein
VWWGKDQWVLGRYLPTYLPALVVKNVRIKPQTRTRSFYLFILLALYIYILKVLKSSAFWDFQKPKFNKNLQISMYGSSTLAKNYRRMFKFIYFHVYLAFSQIWLNIYSFGSLPLWLQHIIDKEKKKGRHRIRPRTTT